MKDPKLISLRGLMQKVTPFLFGHEPKSAISNNHPTTRLRAGFHGISSDESDGDEFNALDQNPMKYVMKTQGIDSDEEDDKLRRWNSQLAWLNNVLESALSWYKQTARAGDSQSTAKSATTRSLVDIALNLHRSTVVGMQQWSLGDLTFGLYLLSLRHTTEMASDTVKGEQIVTSDVVTELIYHAELAKAAYMKNPASLARVSMLRESNVVKFMDKSSVMRPAYYIAVDAREKLVILGIRGTSSIHDLITDLVSHSDEEVTFDGGSVHFGTAKAAEWFLTNELETLRHCLKSNYGFLLRIVGHSLGGATASLLAMMIRKKSEEELGFSPNIVSAVGFASPPCVSRMLSLQSSKFVRTIVLQDDIIPRISAASLLRLRNEILGLDWTSFLRKDAEERKGIVDLVASTVEAFSSVQDVARRYKAYTSRFGPFTEQGVKNIAKQQEKQTNIVVSHPSLAEEELFPPGLIFHIRGNPVFQKNLNKFTEGRERCTLWQAYPNEFFKRIVLSGSFFKDHKCDSYYQGLRDTLKGL